MKINIILRILYNIRKHVYHIFQMKKRERKRMFLPNLCFL